MESADVDDTPTGCFLVWSALTGQRFNSAAADAAFSKGTLQFNQGCDRSQLD